MANKPSNTHAECDKQIDRLTAEVEAQKTTIEELSTKSKRVKTACTETVADYKKRFEEMAAQLERAEAERKTAESNCSAAEKDFRAQLAKLNEEHGKLVKRLREEKDTAIADRQALALELANSNKALAMAQDAINRAGEEPVDADEASS